MPLRAVDVPPPAGDRRRWRLSYLAGNAFELALAFAAIVAAVVFFIDPTVRAEASVGHALRSWTPYWTAMYGLAGVMVCHGLVRPRPQLEIAGLSSLAAAITINGLSIVVYQGWHGVATSVTFLTLTVACGARGWQAWHIAHAQVRGSGGER